MRPFRVEVPEPVLVDLRDRLARTRWPELVAGEGWAYGTDVDVLRDVCAHWADGFDWRRHEAWMNEIPAHLVEVDGATVHVMHARSRHAGALPLVMLHGWPGTVGEFRPVVGPLTDPSPEGVGAADAFDVVLVSLPGFGFSGPLRDGGWDADRMARAIAGALARCGIQRYGVFGTDAGAYVATSLAAHAPDVVVGLHLQIGGVSLARQARADASLVADATEAERAAFSALAHYETVDGAYAFLNGTKPYTVGFGLTDSPVGQAAWILEKLHSWTAAVGDRRDAAFGAVSLDDALAIVTTYWVTGTAASAARFYADAGAAMARNGGRTRTTVPTGCAAFPGDIVVPSRRWAERDYPNLVHWTDMAAGGHFGALEVPELLAADLRAFFRPLR